LKLTEKIMRRSPVKVGAMCAAILLSSIAYAQQPKTPSRAYLAQAPDACQQQPQVPKQDKDTKPDSKPATWTLFLVAVPYNGPWTITAVAAFNNKDNTKDMACNDCFEALTALNNGNPNYQIPGLHREVADARKAEGTEQFLTCLPATAPQQSKSSGTGTGATGD
jgi:hypothetical protein